MNILEKIEKIVKESDTYLTDIEIMVKLFGEEDIKIDHLKIFFDCLSFLEGIGKIVTERNVVFKNRNVYWVGVDNPKLEKLLKESEIL